MAVTLLLIQPLRKTDRVIALLGCTMDNLLEPPQRPLLLKRHVGRQLRRRPTLRGCPHGSRQLRKSLIGRILRFYPSHPLWGVGIGLGLLMSSLCQPFLVGRPLTRRHVKAFVDHLDAGMQWLEATGEILPGHMLKTGNPEGNLFRLS